MSASEVVAFATSGTNQTVQSYFTTGDWVSGKKKRLIIPSGVTIGSTNVSTAALRTNSGFGGLLQVENSGTLVGAGGQPNGGVGGDAFQADTYMTLMNYGTMYAGGGAGGQGGTGGTGYTSVYTRDPSSGFQYLWQTGYGWMYGYITVNGSLSEYHWNGNHYGSNPSPGDGWTYRQGPYVKDGSGWSEYQIYRDRTDYTYYSGGTGGNGGRGQGYDGSAAGGLGGGAGSTNAGYGGTGGTGGAYGTSGNIGGTGSAGNAAGGSAGQAGGLSGYALRNSPYITLAYAGTLVGRT